MTQGTPTLNYYHVKEDIKDIKSRQKLFDLKVKFFFPRLSSLFSFTFLLTPSLSSILLPILKDTQERDIENENVCVH